VRIAIVAPPFISVPPIRYGGTELFVAQLAVGLDRLGADVVVYGNGQSSLPVEVKWLYPESEWPIQGEIYGNFKDINHCAWAMRDAADSSDIIHINGAPGLAHSRFLRQPVVNTIHHPFEQNLTAFYSYYPAVQFVCISEFQRRQHRLPNSRTIPHGVDLDQYQLVETKEPYLSFIGRIAPVKGVHLAIEVAKLSGIPLKIAGQIQPVFQDYYESQVKPHIDGKFIEFIGEADLAAKNELLGKSLAMVFPIQWHEPFGLVMVEAMACGTPVLAMPGGSVAEVIEDGVSGYVCVTVEEMAKRAQSLAFDPKQVRAYVSERFSLETMLRSYLSLYQELMGIPRAGAPETAVA